MGKSKDPVIRQQLAAFYTRTELLRFMNYRVQTALSQGRMPGPRSLHDEAVHLPARQPHRGARHGAHGGPGNAGGESALDGGMWELTFLNQWMVKLGGGTDNIQRNSLAERVLGLPREARADKDIPFSQLV